MIEMDPGGNEMRIQEKNPMVDVLCVVLCACMHVCMCVMWKHVFFIEIDPEGNNMRDRETNHLLGVLSLFTSVCFILAFYMRM